MTRLTAHDVDSLVKLLPELDEGLRRATGRGLLPLAVMTALGPESDPAVTLPGIPEATVIPVTAGAGAIEGFAGAVAAIGEHIGCRTKVAPKTDVAGLAYAAERGAGLVLLADDERFIALDLSTGFCVDNGLATGHAYAMALHAAAGGVSGRVVLVVGLGPVGMAACATLVRLGATVFVWDEDLVRVEVAARSFPVLPTWSLEVGLEATDLVLDATPAPCLIGADWVTGRSVVAAPGLPLGLTEEAAQALGERLIHEPLALGVAAMIAQSCLGIWTDRESRPPRTRHHPRPRLRGLHGPVESGT